MAAGFDISELPEGCIANVLSLTSPLDVGRLSAVSASFRSASDSDGLWRRFLPPNYASLIAQSDYSSSLLSLPLKELYFSLCSNPILIDDGRKSFWLDKWSGKHCYMLSARDLSIIWGSTPRYWRWISSSEPKSRFSEVAVLIDVCWLEIHGRINVEMLSPSTRYAAYLVFSSAETVYGFEDRGVEVGIGLAGSEEYSKKSVYLDLDNRRRQQPPVFLRPFRRRLSFFNPLRADTHSASLDESNGQPSPEQEDRNGKYPKERSDNWREVELGEFTTREGLEGELEMSVLEVKGGNWKSGLIIQGIEIRPKESK